MKPNRVLPSRTPRPDHYPRCRGNPYAEEVRTYGFDVRDRTAAILKRMRRKDGTPYAKRIAQYVRACAEYRAPGLAPMLSAMDYWRVAKRRVQYLEHFRGLDWKPSRGGTGQRAVLSLTHEGQPYTVRLTADYDTDGGGAEFLGEFSDTWKPGALDLWKGEERYRARDTVDKRYFIPEFSPKDAAECRAAWRSEYGMSKHESDLRARGTPWVQHTQARRYYSDQAWEFYFRVEVWEGTIEPEDLRDADAIADDAIGGVGPTEWESEYFRESLWEVMSEALATAEGLTTNPRASTKPAGAD